MTVARGGDRPRPAPTQLRASLLKSASTFCGEYEPLAYVIEPIVRTAAVYTITAKTGSGKTGFLVSGVFAVSTGRKDILGMDVERGRVAYLAFENPDDVRMRMIVGAFALNIDLQELGDQLVVLDARMRPADLVKLLDDHTRSGGPFRLVVLDTFAAGFDGRDINDNVEGGEYVRRLRPITQLPGLPALIIAAHPTKNAPDDNLVPYGAGAILNEVDGNLTLSKKQGQAITVLHHQGKFRGLEFEPRTFRFDLLSSPDVLDNKGRQVTLPVVKPVSAESVEVREQQEIERPIAILRVLSRVEKASQRDLVGMTSIPKTSIKRHVDILKGGKLVEEDLGGGLRITPKGRKELDKLS